MKTNFSFSAEPSEPSKPSKPSDFNPSDIVKNTTINLHIPAILININIQIPDCHVVFKQEFKQSDNVFSFYVDFNSRYITYQTLLEKVIYHIMYFLINQAVNEKILLQSKGEYYEN
jgi:hypothetical protein